MAIAPPASCSTRVLAWAQLGDEILARRAAAGNDAAFTALYERYHGPLLGYCRSILLSAEDADDAAQNALENALRALPARDAGRPLRPWLYRIAHNEAVTILRRRHAHDELGPDTEPAVCGPDVHAEQRGRLDQLVQDLRSLPERQRGALVMRELGGLSYEEVGAALGVTVVNARRAVFDARSALQDVADGHDADCVAIRRRLSDGDRRRAGARGVRAHLRSCDQCRSFQLGICTRRAELPALAPWLGGATAAGALGLGGSVAGGGSALIGAGGGLGWASLPTAAKGLAVAAVVATTGTAATVEVKRATEPDRPAARAQMTAPAREAASDPLAKLSGPAAAAAAPTRRPRVAQAMASRHSNASDAPRTPVSHDGPALRKPTSEHVAKPPPPAAQPPSSPPPPASAPGPPSASTPPGATAAQKLEQIQAQIHAAIAKAKAAAAAGTPGGLQSAGTIVASTISSVRTMISNVLASFGLSVPAAVANASTRAPAGASAAGVTAPAQQMLGAVNALLGRLARS